MVKLTCLYLTFFFFSCKDNLFISNGNEHILIAKEDTVKNTYAFYNINGIKKTGDYQMVFTDTIFKYGMVADSGIFLIDTSGKRVYEIFKYDNGPDSPGEGLIRIIKNGKIGYADAYTYEIIIEPQYDCAYPFENGKAKVSKNCSTVADGENISWTSEDWIYITKK